MHAKLLISIAASVLSDRPKRPSHKGKCFALTEEKQRERERREREKEKEREMEKEEEREREMEKEGERERERRKKRERWKKRKRERNPRARVNPNLLAFWKAAGRSTPCENPDHMNRRTASHPERHRRHVRSIPAA